MRRGAFLAVLTCAIVAAGAQAALALGTPTINAPTPTTNLVNNTTSYGASVTYGAFLSTETLQTVTFTFPANTDLSGVSASTVTVSGGSNVPVVNNVAHTVTLSPNLTSSGISSRTYTVTIGGVVNPSEPAAYTNGEIVTAVSNRATTSATRTNTFNPNATAPLAGPVSLGSYFESAVTTTTVPVKVGTLGRLGADPAPGGVVTPNRITITFPAGYTVPASPAAASVTVSGTPLTTAPTVSGRRVTLRIPAGVTIAKSTTATVSFLPSFGMANPAPGTYSVVATTDAETGAATTAGYTIYAAPTTLSVTTSHAPSPAYVTPGATRAVDGFSMVRNASSKTVSVSSVTIADAGTSPSANVSGVTIYRDNGDSVFGAGDTALNTPPATFSGSAATVTFASPEAVTTTPLQYWVVYSFAAGAADAATAGSEITTLSAVADTVSDTTVAGPVMTVDAVPPTVSIAAPAPDGTYLVGSIPPYTIAGVAADTVSGVTGVRVAVQRASDSNWWNGLGWQSAATSVAAFTADGWATWTYPWAFTPPVQNDVDTYTITAAATDAVGFTTSDTRGSIGIDNVPPSLVSAVAVDPTHVDVTFTEPLAASTVAPGDFSIPGLSLSEATLQPGAAVVRLATTTQTPEQAYTASVTLGSVADVAGNANVAPTSASFFGTGAEIRVASAGQPPAAWATAGAVLAADGFTLQKVAGVSSATVATLTVEDTGTATGADVTGVTIYRDANANGVFDAGTDTTLNAAPAAFSGIDALVTLDAPEPVTAGATQYFVVYRFAAAPTDGCVATSKIVAVGTTASLVDDATVRGNPLTIDPAPPGIPVLSASAVSTDTIGLSWTGVTDATSGLAYYALRRDDGSLVTTTTATSMVVTGLVPATVYGFYVEALDVAGNVSTSNTLLKRTLSDQYVAPGAIAPHVSTGPDTDVCAMCHATHSSASGIGVSVDSTSDALVHGMGTRENGDAQLCYTCHGVGVLGSSRDVESEFGSGPGHRLTPATSAYGPSHKQCGDCHDAHGSERQPSGLPFPALLRSRDASGNFVDAGVEYCITCHAVRAGNEFPGLALWNQTAHSTIATPASGTGITCSVCHAPHGSPYAPSIQPEIDPPAAPATSTITANDRQLCLACHTPAERSWVGAADYATSAHGTSPATIAAGGEWASADSTTGSPVSRTVGECQNCHAPMGRSDSAGGIFPRLLNEREAAVCLECHKVGGPAVTDFASIAHTDAPGTDSLVVAYGAAPQTVDYGRVDVFSRASTSSATLAGPRPFARNGDVGAVAAGDIDGDGRREVLVTKPGAATLDVMSASPFSGLAEAATALDSPATYVAVGDVASDAGNLKEVVTADATTVRVYRWNATGLDPITSYAVTGQVTGLAVGKVLSGTLDQVVVTTHQGTAPDQLMVLQAADGTLTAVGSYPTRSMPTGPSIGDLDGDGLGEIAVANSGETAPTLSVFSGAGSEIMTGGSATDASATATVISDVLPGITPAGTTGAEVSVALAGPGGVARVEVFPQSGTGLGSPLTGTLAARSNPGALAAGDLDGDGRKELVAGLSGVFSRDASSAAPPGVAIVHASVDGSSLGIVDTRTGGGVEQAGSTGVAVADIGSIGESRHPVEAADQSHVSTEAAGMPEHVACVDCHNPHSATAATATAPALPGEFRGAGGVSVLNNTATDIVLTQKAPVTAEYEVCLKCHSTWAGAGATSIAAQVNTLTASFHPVEGPSPATNATGDTLEASMTATSLVYCTDCHGDSTAADPPGPHRSADAPLLARPTIGVTSADSSGLCYQCHRYDIYGTGLADGTAGTSGFWGSTLPPGRQALHALHTQAGFTCASCHVSHGSVDKPYLLRNDLGWDGTVPNGGACQVDCHTAGARHEYTR